MPTIVQKYGGSSLSDVERLCQVADKVCAEKRAGNNVVVVVSAMGKTTDGLLALAGQVSKSPPRRELDMLVSTGERVSMALVSMAIQERGFEAVSFTGSQSGIITNDRHFDARIIEVRPYRIEDELVRGRIVIVAGFQGVSYRKEITTLGRGGSDTTAVALAAALGAQRCEIYSDVEGVFTADPRVVPDARQLPEIGYGELQEMAHNGARVLNAQAVEFARRAGISIHARATALSYPGSPETVVHAGARPAATSVRAVSSEKSVVRCRATGSVDVLRTLLDAARDFELPLKDLSFSAEGAQGDGRVSFLLSLSNVPDWERARQGLVKAVARMQIDEGLGTVSLVGEGLQGDPEILVGTTALFSRLGVQSTGITTTPNRITLLVASECIDDCVRAAHALVTPASAPCRTDSCR